MQTFIRELWELDKPTIAAVNGAAVGPGAHLALACDFVFVHPRTRFMWTFAKWGLVADAGGAYLLPRLVGLPTRQGDGDARRRRDRRRSGRPRPRVQVRRRSRRRCCPTRSQSTRKLAAGPDPFARASKRLLNATFETDLADSLELEGHFQALATTSPDLVEGMAAFREKRDAKFDGT